MVNEHSWRIHEVILAVLAFLGVLFVNRAIPFLILPIPWLVFWTTGFSQCMANGALFDFFAHDFGIPKPASIAFGLAGAWPTSLLIRLGLHPADAYAGMTAFWLGIAMFSAYRIARRFLGGTRLIALFGSVIWMTMPIIWAHGEYGMLSLGIALLSFYFLTAFRLFDVKEDRVAPSSIALYFVAAIVSVFMDGYTFMMFAVGASFLLFYSLLTRPEIRSTLVKVAVPIHVCSFALAYVLYAIYIGKLNFKPDTIDFFRGWGLDLAFTVIPTKGMLWLPDLLGMGAARTDMLYFGDHSVWETTFALPVILLGLLAWTRVRHKTKIATGVLLVAVFAFYMALGPSLKINSTKPEALQLSRPGHQSCLMAPEYAIAPTGNAWISQKLPGFNVMRASYRWSALGIFALWVLIVLCMSGAGRKEVRIWLAGGLVLALLNLPHFERTWRSGVLSRMMFQRIDLELVAELGKTIHPGEKVVFLPWRNDFLANYVAPKAGFRTFNIGGDKNLAAARPFWPSEMRVLGPDSKLEPYNIMSSLKMLINDAADVIVFPYINMHSAASRWPSADETSDAVKKLQPTITALRALPYLDVTETNLFAVVRLRPEFTGPADRPALLSSIIGDIRYPIVVGGGFAEAPYVLQEGWHSVEPKHVWSKSEAKLLLPVPKDCDTATCGLKLFFWVFGASPSRPVDVVFSSGEPGWAWSEKITATSGGIMGLSIPLAGAKDVRSITISVPDATSPQLLKVSRDKRTLGIALQRIELIKPAESAPLSGIRWSDG